MISTHALVVDDEDLVRGTIRDILIAHGWAVTEASGGEEAIRLYEPGVHAVVVLDLVMPGLGGVETLCALRARDEGVPVLVVSGYAAPGTVHAAMELQPCHFLAKPFRTAQLMAAIDVLTGLVSSSL